MQLQVYDQHDKQAAKMAACLYIKLCVYFMIFSYLKFISIPKRVYNEDKHVVITDSYGLDTDGLDFNRYHNIIFLYRVRMQRFKLGKRFNLSFPIRRQTKRGVSCLLLCSRPFQVDLTTCVDVSTNPGPDCVGKLSGHIINRQPCCAWRPSCLDDSSSDKIKYSKQQF